MTKKGEADVDPWDAELAKDPRYSKLPDEVKQNIMGYVTKRRGRPKNPPPTPMMIADTQKKNQLRMRYNQQAKKAIESGDFETYIDIVEEQYAKGLIGKRAYDKRYDDFLDSMVKEEMALDEASTDIADMVLKQAQKEVKIEEGAPVKFKVVEEFSEPSMTSERTQKKMLEASRIRKAVETMRKQEREAALKKRMAEPLKRSQLADHFSSYDKSTEGKAKQNAPDEPRKDEAPKYKDVPKKIQNDIRQVLADQGMDIAYEDIAFAWDNNLDDVSKERIYAGDLMAIGDIQDLIDVAKKTSQFVPDYLEPLFGMTTEERQKAFHLELIKMRMEAIKQKKEEKATTNFDKNAEAGGGINQGETTKTLKKDEEYKQPEIFQNYEEILDNKLTDDAYVKELYKGINPNTTSILGKTEEGDAEFFATLNDINNLQDEEEIKQAINNIEILSGGSRDTLFGEQDLLSTRRNNPASRGHFQNDMPYDDDDNPAPVARGRQAEAVEDVDPAILERQDREQTATTIGLSLGILANAYRGFSRNDIPNSRAGGEEDILSSINQNLRLLGKRGLYGDDRSLGADDDMYEGRSISSRMNDVLAFSNSKNPNYLMEEEKPDANALTRALMFNKGAAMGSTLPQLRQQEFAYKQAGRKTAHDGYAFMRGGNATAIKINGEFDP
jgi:hypothetical protein